NVWARETTEPRKGVVKNWQAVSGGGYAISPQIQITSGSAAAMAVEMVSMDLMIEGGGIAS
ncbi:hypothetical protein BTA51_29155, partial [Hahella sp. CCB-MM4]|uniref:hypothetical protein n=2 Tax=Pseudomonadota TaxID=1224 RepID=UPI000BC9AD75